ncbi:VWA domain-containing protein [Vibrio sp. MA40-2]|uniref:VWA domain-containing protein n=1 Tax=Vibrio sp. MA40-2 TaxID=3391828 RepID=UPI0039A68D60
MKIINKICIVFLCLLSFSLRADPRIAVSFVMDESGSVSSSNFHLEQDGFLSALDNLPLDSSIELSILGFSSYVKVIVDPTVLNANTIDSVKSQLSSNSQKNGGTNMSDAISSAAQYVSSSVAQSRIICLATDGAPNSRTSTTSEAEIVRDAGIYLNPVGIGLSSYNKTFLDSISSNPPVPNPADFIEFATVVTNDCLGTVQSALNIEVSPSIVDFGSFNRSTVIEDAQICANDGELLTIRNDSNQRAFVDSLQISGADEEHFEIISVGGKPSDTLSYPLTIAPMSSIDVFVRFTPTSTPEDGSTYIASLSASTTDSLGSQGIYTSMLSSKVDSSVPACLAISAYDAYPAVSDISDSGALMANEQPVDESYLETFFDNNEQYLRIGLVADGNSRLILRARTRLTEGKIRFKINDPSITEARLFTLDNAPTYIGDTRNYQAGSESIDIDVFASNDGYGQASVVLRAGERFLGKDAAYSEFEVDTCILDDQDECETTTSETTSLIDTKAPVVLNHGLWAMPNSFGKIGPGVESDSSSGLFEYLKAKNYLVSFVEYSSDADNYPNYKGPSELSNPISPYIENPINNLCAKLRNETRVACTRADIIGHSMGGLMARSYILRHLKYKEASNFNQGSIRRLVTLGTPHTGSGLANLLTHNDTEIGSCIRDEEKTYFDGPFGLDVKKTGHEMVDLIVTLLESVGNHKVDSAIDDLKVGDQNTFLSQDVMTEDLDVPIFAVYGNIGSNLGLDLNGFAHYAPSSIKDSCPDLNDCADEVLEYLTGCTVSDLFQGEESDGIVPLSSGKWSSYIAASSDEDDYIKEMPNEPHLGMGTSDDIATAAESLLNETKLVHFYSTQN